MRKTINRKNNKPEKQYEGYKVRPCCQLMLLNLF